MNPDLPFPDSNPDDALTPEARLEAQITALLLGELSPTDAARLRERIESDPALRLLHDRLRIAIELTREVARPQSSQEAAPADSPRLDPARRAQLLAAFRTPPEPVLTLPQPPPTRTQRREWLAMAAMLVVLLGAGAGVVLLNREPASPQTIAYFNGPIGALDAAKSAPVEPPSSKPSDGFELKMAADRTEDESRESVPRFNVTAASAVVPPPPPPEARFKTLTSATPRQEGSTPTDLSRQPKAGVEDAGLNFFDKEKADAAPAGAVAHFDFTSRGANPSGPTQEEFGRSAGGVAGVGGGIGGAGVGISESLKRESRQLGDDKNAVDSLAAMVPAPDLSLGRRLLSYNGALNTNAPVQLGLQVLRESESLAQLQDLPAVQVRDLERSNRAQPVTAPIPQPEIVTAEQPLSTFSLNVSDVSFKLAAASLEQGVLPDPASIRTEEFINAFNYHDPEPAGTAPVAFHWEQARDPFSQQRDLFRFSIRTAATGRPAGTPLNLVLLIDNSGSMERADRVAIRSECLRILAAQLQPADRISVVTFSRTARLWMDGVPGNQVGDLAERFGTLTPEGGTHLEGALELAYQTASRHLAPGSINRVVLLTDGAANLGDVSPATLRQRVEENRRRGIALDCFGIGWDGLDDDLLEQLSRNGDGRYGFINSPGDATANFASKLAGALQVAASDVKVQVEFNPLRVATHRQVGYARHQLTAEQFRDNTVDAAELAAAESGNALYIAQILPAGQGPIATVRVRFKVPATGEYREHAWTVPHNGPARSLEQSTASLRLAAVAAGFAEWLSNSPHAGEVTPEALLRLLSGIPASHSADPRPAQLESMIQQARRLRPE